MPLFGKLFARFGKIRDAHRINAVGQSDQCASALKFVFRFVFENLFDDLQKRVVIRRAVAGFDLCERGFEFGAVIGQIRSKFHGSANARLFSTTF